MEIVPKTPRGFVLVVGPVLGLIFFPFPLSLFLFFFSVTRAFQRCIGGLECILHEGERTHQTSDEIVDFSSLGRSAPTIPGSFLWHAYGKTPRFFIKKVTSSNFPETSQPKSCVLVGRRCAVFMNYAALKTSEKKIRNTAEQAAGTVQ